MLKFYNPFNFWSGHPHSNLPEIILFVVSQDV